MLAEPIVDKIAEHGLAGLLLALTIIVIYVLNKQLNTLQKEHAKESQLAQKAHLDAVQEVQRLRVEDQKLHQAQLVDLIKTCTLAISSSANAAAAEKEAVGELRESLDKFVEDSRRNTPRR